MPDLIDRDCEGHQWRSPIKLSEVGKDRCRYARSYCTEILHQIDLLPDSLPWNQFRAESLRQLKLTRTPNKVPFQLVLTSFSCEPEIDLKALVRCLLPRVQLSVTKSEIVATRLATSVMDSEESPYSPSISVSKY